MTGERDYSPRKALQLYLDNLRRTGPSPEVLEVIEEIEAELREPPEREAAAGLNAHAAGRFAGA